MSCAEEYRQAIADYRDRYVDLLGQFVAIDSVSQLTADPQRVEASGHWVAEQLRLRGAEVTVSRTPKPDGSLGHPTIVGHFPGPDSSPHVVLYAHHDVMPAGDDDEWTVTKPFVGKCHGERFYGRGAADDGAGLILHLAAIDLLRSRGNGTLPCSVTVLSEGEEEIGSPSFSSFLERYGDQVDGDVLIVADGGNWAVGTPSLVTSLRGVIQAFVTVSSLDHPVHSGEYGGVAVDSVTAMCRLISTFHDERGNVAIEGLLGSQSLPSQDATPVAYDVDFDEDILRLNAGILDGVPLMGEGSIAERLWLKPSITVIGIDAVDVDHSSCALQPSCRARLSLRTAPGEDTERAYRALVDHIHQHAPFGVKVEVICDELGPACLVDSQSPAVQHSLKAMEEAWQAQPVRVGMGASIPFVAQYQERFPQAQILVVGVEDPDSRAHGGDESVHLGELERAIVSQCVFIEEFSRS